METSIMKLKIILSYIIVYIAAGDLLLIEL